MKVMAQSAQVQAAQMQEVLALRQSLQAEQIQMVRLVESMKAQSEVTAVKAASAGQNLNARA